MLRVLTKNRIFVILSLCLSKIIKFEIELENITDEDLNFLAQKLEGYSGADINILCRTALMNPVTK